MKFAAGFIVFSILFATAYGAIYSIVYPLVSIDGSLLSLFAILGLATTLILAAIFRTKPKT
jgi:hypothetical protein